MKTCSSGGTTFNCLIMENTYKRFRMCFLLECVFCYFKSGVMLFGYYRSAKKTRDLVNLKSKWLTCCSCLHF